MGPETKIYCAGEGQWQFNRWTNVILSILLSPSSAPSSYVPLIHVLFLSKNKFYVHTYKSTYPFCPLPQATSLAWWGDLHAPIIWRAK
jgi:hypothetical protein